MNLIIITMGKIASLFRISLWVLSGPEDPWLHPPKRNEAIRHGGWGELYLKSEKKIKDASRGCSIRFQKLGMKRKREGEKLRASNNPGELSGILRKQKDR